MTANEMIELGEKIKAEHGGNLPIYLYGGFNDEMPMAELNEYDHLFGRDNQFARPNGNESGLPERVILHMSGRHHADCEDAGKPLKPVPVMMQVRAELLQKNTPSLKIVEQ